MKTLKVPLIISDRIVIFIILINTLVLTLDAFKKLHNSLGSFFFFVDYLCVLYFLIEIILKIKTFSWEKYLKNSWNKFDFILVMASLPSLLAPLFPIAHSFSILLILRTGRLFRFLRILKFIPNAEKIWSGVIRSLKASLGIFIALFLYNFILAMIANTLFSEVAPQYFGDPLISFYSLFKVFTVEGWYEIPKELAVTLESNFTINSIRLYFIFSVLTGGILGLSLANAIFVDEMTADNNENLENEIQKIQLQLNRIEKKLNKSKDI